LEVTPKKALEQVPGVAEAKIDYARKTATVKFDPEKASPAMLVKATTDAGFLATPHSSKP
jgi:periplasmic mercuric ion binding protein